MTVNIQELSNHSYIDHELSANLDSTDAFEGPEKLLEIWFYPTIKSIPNGKSLLSIDISQWVEMLKLVKCEILSMKQTSKMNFFLLSESSMFVYDHRITLKTCGTTTTLFCLPKLFEIISANLQWDLEIVQNGKEVYNPYKVFYSRRSFMFPDKQKPIHRNWRDEVEYLNKFFINGTSFLVGKNAEDKSHWNLYITETNRELKTVEDSDVEVNDHEDETLEILMTGLDQEQAKKFFHKHSPKEDEGHINGFQMTKDTKIDEIYENYCAQSIHHDAFAFTPCGYSSNIIIDEEFYYTLHVTPEKGWSYASFESNVQYDNSWEVMGNVLDIFQPSEFCLTFFNKKTNGKLRTFRDDEPLPGYKKMDRIVYDLDDYQLLYVRYRK